MKIETIKRKHEKRLMKLPNVIGVGIGYKAGRKVIKVYVTIKVPKSKLRKGDSIPKLLDGWRTDVEVVGVIEAQTKNKHETKVSDKNKTKRVN